MVVLPSLKTNIELTQSSNDFIIATQATIMCLMVNCTAAPLLQIGRQLGAGGAGPIIGYTGNGTYGSGGSGFRSRNRVSLKDAYDMDSITRGKLGPRNVQSTVVAGGRANGHNGRLVGQHNHGRGRHDVDGISVESDSSQKIIIRKTVEQEVSRS